MFKQTEEKYKSIKMGFGGGSIYDFGCYLVSLVNGLNLKGWSFTPEGFNQLLKDKQAWTGEFKNYIDVDRIDDVLPHIFVSYQKYEPFNDMALLKSLLDGGYIVIGKVNAAGIGGSGSHFVLITGIEGANAIIFDPYTGEHQAVAKRYGKLGNILSLRVFGVKSPTKEEEMPEFEWYGLDPNNKASLNEAVKTWAAVRDGKYITKSEHEKALDSQEDKLVAEHNKALESFKSKASWFDEIVTKLKITKDDGEVTSDTVVRSVTAQLGAKDKAISDLDKRLKEAEEPKGVLVGKRKMLVAILTPLMVAASKVVLEKFGIEISSQELLVIALGGLAFIGVEGAKDFATATSGQDNPKKTDQQ